MSEHENRAGAPVRGQVPSAPAAHARHDRQGCGAEVLGSEEGNWLQTVLQ